MAVGMLKNYGWLGSRGKKIIVTFKSLAESQICCCGQRFILELQPWEKDSEMTGIYFYSVLNSKFLSQKVKPLLAC